MEKENLMYEKQVMDRKRSNWLGIILNLNFTISFVQKFLADIIFNSVVNLHLYDEYVEIDIIQLQFSSNPLDK